MSQPYLSFLHSHSVRSIRQAPGAPRAQARSTVRTWFSVLVVLVQVVVSFSAAVVAVAQPPAFAPLVSAPKVAQAATIQNPVLARPPRMEKGVAVPLAQAATEIAGKVFYDGNNNGTADATEVGYSDVTVTAYDANGTAVATTTSAAATGNYLLTGLTAGQSYRMEFTWPHTGPFTQLQSAVNGTSSASSVQFVQAGQGNVNFGVEVPERVCPSGNPRIIASAGQDMGGAGGVASWLYNQMQAIGDGTADLSRDMYADATWGGASPYVGVPVGMSIDQKKQLVYFSPTASQATTSFTGTPVFPAPPDGLSAIYVADYSGTNHAYVSHKLLVRLDTVGVSIAGSATEFGKYGLGEVALDEAGKNLYVVNMGQGLLHRIDLSGVNYASLPTTAPTASNITNITIPSALTACTNGVFRPTALTRYSSLLYLGGICDGSSGVNSDLSAKVLSYDPATSTWQNAFSFEPELFTAGGATGAGLSQVRWGSGSGVAFEPVLRSIGFDDTGSMLIGISNRLMHGGGMVGVALTGHVLRTYRAANGSFTLENAGVSGPFTSTAYNVTGTDGPGQDWFFSQSLDANHIYLFAGGVNAVPGKGVALYGGMDPIATGTYGARYLNWQTGQSIGGYNIGGQKAGLMGDMEQLCDDPPLEIGNRVWNDANSNGIQDPSEAGINGVTVTLYHNGVQVGTTTTANGGQYYFNSSNVTLNGAAGIVAGTGTVGGNSAYEVRIPNVTGGSKQAALGANTLTTANADASAVGDLHDSNGTLSGTEAVYAIPYANLQGAGYNNHTYDFGFAPAPTTGTIRLVKNTTGGDSAFTFTGSNASLNQSITTVSGMGSSSVITLTAGTYTVTENALSGWQLVGLACSGDANNNSKLDQGNRQAVIGLDAGENIVCTFINAQPPTPPTSVLTVTKTISGTGTGPFNITVAGPSGYISTTTINGGQTKLFTGLVQGVYTVTEATPAGWTTVYTATPGTGGSSHAVVTLQNSNTATLATTPITGKVFRDYNSDGLITANGTVTDTGVSGVTITAYDKNGNAVGSTTSAANGTYTLNPTAVGPYRVVFTNLPAGYEPTAHGSQNGTSTQFVTNAAGATGVNLGINIPEDYSQANLRVAIPVHTAGAINPTNTTVRALFSFTYGAPKTGDSTGIPDMLQTGSGVENPTTDATQGQVGATWGLGYDRQDKRLFAAAVLQRQVGLGPLGLGGIYVVDYSSGAGSYVGSFTLQGVTPANGGSAIDLGSVTRVIVSGAGTSGTANGLNDDPTQPSKDIDAFAKVGKVGYGDIDMDSTHGILWAVNLNQQALISINVRNYTPSTNGPVPGAVNQYLLSNLSGVPTCTNGVFRPWALKLYHGDGYLGGVCSAENAAASGTYGFSDIMFYVLKFDPTNPSAGFTNVASAANYNHAEEASLYHKWCDDPQANASQTACDYQLDGAFRNVPQPILTDVEFREDGSLIAGITDRYTMQQMTRNYDARSGTGTLLSTKSSGDLIFWCKVGNSYVPEGSANCPVNDPATAPDTKLMTSPLSWLTTDGLSGSGEFFYSDWFVGNPSASLGQAQHNETATGGLALLLGAQQVLSTSADPVSYVDTDPSGGFGTQGVRWFNTQTGSRVASYQLIDYPYNTFNTPPLFAKGNGLGDLELLSDPAPIEIGNRVWNDINGNGIQDPGELGLSGLTVSLQGPINTVTTNTDANGLYYFNVSRSTAYTITIMPPSGYSVTTANAAALSGASATSNAAISDTIDSDAVVVGGKAMIYYTTGSAGQNNHGLDFGFTQPASGKAGITNIAPVKIGNRLWIEADGDGDATTGTVTPVVGQVVTASSSSGKVYTATTDSNGLYTITVPANAIYTVTTGTPAGMLPSTVITNVANDSNAAANNDKNHRNTGTTVTVANTDNLSVDFGFYPSKAHFGDRVWIESDDDGVAATGIITPVVGMVITATSGVNVYTATTNSQGYYSFTVAPGSYTVHYGVVPASYGTVRVSGGAVGSATLSGNSGSYAQSGNPDGNHPQNTNVTVAGGEANWQVDYAFTRPSTDLSLTKTVDKTVVAQGAKATYTLVLTNHGPDVATNIQVRDLLPAGVTWVGDSGAGAYDHTTGLWTVNSLAANASVTLTITVTLQ